MDPAVKLAHELCFGQYASGRNEPTSICSSPLTLRQPREENQSSRKFLEKFRESGFLPILLQINCERELVGYGPPNAPSRPVSEVFSPNFWPKADQGHLLDDKRSTGR